MNNIGEMDLVQQIKRYKLVGQQKTRIIVRVLNALLLLKQLEQGYSLLCDSPYYLGLHKQGEVYAHLLQR